MKTTKQRAEEFVTAGGFRKRNGDEFADTMNEGITTLLEIEQGLVFQAVAEKIESYPGTILRPALKAALITICANVKAV